MVCRLCIPISIIKIEPFPTFSPYPTIHDLVRQVSIVSISPLFWMNYHPNFVPYHDFEVSMSFHPNYNNVFSLTLQDSTSFLHRQIWFPTTWEFSNQSGLTFWALWYWTLNNATNRNNLHMFRMTVLVSPIYTLEFLTYPFLAYVIYCIVLLSLLIWIWSQQYHRLR